MARRLLFSAVILIVFPSLGAYAQTEQPDNYVWLEDVNGARSMQWVKEHNAATAKVLESDPQFAPLEADALKILQSPDRLPTPSLRAGQVYNFWQDAAHVRGILRRTSISSYLSPKPKWSTVLDIDALGKKEKKSWVYGDMVTLQPDDHYAMLNLSEGGEDAHIYREFDLTAGKFVKNGFSLPRAKSDVVWVDRNHLLVTTEWGPGTLTRSGYPYIAKLWTRGTPLQSAKELYRGLPTEVGVGSAALRDGDGHEAIFVVNYQTFFEAQYNLLSRGKMVPLTLPKRVDVNGLVKNRLIVSLRENWTPVGSKRTYPQGSVLSLDMDAVRREPKNLKPTVVFQPTSKEFAQSVATTKSAVLLDTLENVQGRAYVCRVDRQGQWHRKKLAVGDNLAVDIVSTSPSSDRFFVNTSGFTTPQTFYFGDATRGSMTVAKSRKPQFKASDLTVEQLWATSKDGTKIPYFVVRRKSTPYDGTNPTLLEAYGGFQASQTAYYSGGLGKLWLERGGVYVLANIRGGGEFGPAWHQAGLKTHRQRIYDDFYAVGHDLVNRKITSPAHLGIRGGSNGGLLVGVAMTQHPEMWNAVVIEIPLLDMLGFEHIAAGASWVDEYGSASVPEERAFLASISPYNQLHPDVTYPEPLIFTTTRDDRVGPVHARKFAARMEEFGKPFFYDEITEGGHGEGADLRQAARTNATIYTYLWRKLR